MSNAAIAVFLSTATLAAGTITTSQPLTHTQTWNNVAVTFRGTEWVYTISAAAVGSTVARWLGGAAGTTVLASLSSIGDLTVAGAGVYGGGLTVGANAVIGNLIITSSATILDGRTDGKLVLYNQATTGFTSVLFGGIDATFPSLKRSTTALQARLADDSAYGGFEAGNFGAGGVFSATTFLNLAAGTTGVSPLRFIQGVAPTSPVDGDMWRQDNTNTGWKIRINGVTKTVTVS